MPDTLRPRRPSLAFALAALAACGPADAPEPGAVPEPADLVGTWRLDAVTREWLPRACVRLGFPDPAAAGFEVEEADGDLVVRLQTPHRTTWRGPARRRSFEGRQILPTSESGRFCGRETPVVLRLREVRPGVLRGSWTTPGCDVCPDRPFGATWAERAVER